MEPVIKQKSLVERGSAETWKNKDQSDEVQRDEGKGALLVKCTRVELKTQKSSFHLILCWTDF